MSGPFQTIGTASYRAHLILAPVIDSVWRVGMAAPVCLQARWGRFQRSTGGRSTYPKVFGRFLPAVRRDLIAHLRALIQRAQTCSLDGRDMDEHVLAASVGLNESIPLRRIEPLHCTYCHVASPTISEHGRMLTEIWRKERAARHGCTKKPRRVGAGHVLFGSICSRPWKGRSSVSTGAAPSRAFLPQSLRASRSADSEINACFRLSARRRALWQCPCS